MAEIGSTAKSYEILCKLAEGGMAEIFLARAAGAAGLRRHVVLKRILPSKAGDVQFVKMFLEEARVASQLQHPNIAQVYDVGQLGASYFFTMEYVHGETTRSILFRAHELEMVLPIGAVLAIIADSAAGLGHAHKRLGIDGRPLGIVHRDVSPANLLVSFAGHVKVVDFGVAKAANSMIETQSGTVKGKIGYLSPEQCRGFKLDARSDLFSLGIVMWELLTTRRLFRRAADFETMVAIANEPATPPSLVRLDVPPDVDAVVLKLLAKDPADRFQDSDEVIEAIETAAVRNGANMSRSGLGRLVRDLFGAREEPWVHIEREREVITVSVQGVEPDSVVPQVLDGELANLERRLQSASFATAAKTEADVERTTSRVPAPDPDPFADDDTMNTTLIEAPHVQVMRMAALPPTPTPVSSIPRLAAPIPMVPLPRAMRPSSPPGMMPLRAVRPSSPPPIQPLSATLVARSEPRASIPPPMPAPMVAPMPPTLSHRPFIFVGLALLAIIIAIALIAGD